MKVKHYKSIVYCMHDDERETILSTGDEKKCSCGDGCWESQDFSEAGWNEYEYFDCNEKWKDESCANYVGYKMKLNNYNIIVNRSSCASPRLFDITKVGENVSSNSDPFGRNPDMFKDRQDELTLDEIKKIVNKHLRQQKLERIINGRNI